MMKMSRRGLLGGIAALGVGYGLGWATPQILPYFRKVRFRRAIDAVLPLKPVATGLDIGPAVAKLVEAGAIDPYKFIAAHQTRGAIPDWVMQALKGNSHELDFSTVAAPYNLNLLWPLGLATKAAFNADSPLNGPDLPNFASTGGWTLGREDNGGAYFNAVETLTLSEDQSRLVRRLAENIYRPCCGNSAFFQDCNHGSAMLGLLELAASQGRSEAKILQLAKVANGFWYPQEYVEMALYFDTAEGTPWRDVPADRLLSSEFSSIAGYQGNVRAALADRGLLDSRPQYSGGSGCAV